jgi:hypothetical protein
MAGRKKDPEDEGKVLIQHDKKIKGASTEMTGMQAAFVHEYVRLRNPEQAAIAAGYDADFAAKQARKLLNPRNFPLVVAAIKEKLEELWQTEKLEPAQVLQYIHDVLNFQPIDWFAPGEDGGWLCTLEDYRLLPSRVKRLIESATAKQTTLETGEGTSTHATVEMKFVSKETALRLAAKYQLDPKVTKSEHTVRIEWGSMMNRQPMPRDADPVEKKILMLGASTAPKKKE